MEGSRRDIFQDRHFRCVCPLKGMVLVFVLDQIGSETHRYTVYTVEGVCHLACYTVHTAHIYDDLHVCMCIILLIIGASHRWIPLILAFHRLSWERSYILYEYLINNTEITVGVLLWLRSAPAPIRSAGSTSSRHQRLREVQSYGVWPCKKSYRRVIPHRGKVRSPCARATAQPSQSARRSCTADQ